MFSQGSASATISLTDELAMHERVPRAEPRADDAVSPADADADDGAVTRLLQALRDGQPGSSDRLLTLLYDELRALARGHLRRERPEHTLSATGLVHEAYLRLVQHRQQNWRNRAHFFGAASQAMRRVLVDYARGRLSIKRQAGVRVELTDCDPMEAPGASLDDVIAIDAALDTLDAINPRLVRIVECRYIVGLTIEETAEALGVSHTTVSEGWRFARAWLERALRSDAPRQPQSPRAWDDRAPQPLGRERVA